MNSISFFGTESSNDVSMFGLLERLSVVAGEIGKLSFFAMSLNSFSLFCG